MAFPDEISNSRSHGPQSVREMPLFPLDIVLFPGMKMSLHIFEDRYKEMIKRCLEESRLFGIILVRPDQANRDPRRLKTFRIGCTARITEVEKLPEGEFNLEIEGVERFHLVEQHEVESYRTGIVEIIEDRSLVGTEVEVVDDLRNTVQALLKEFLTRQLALMGQRIVEFDLPRDAKVLSLITACILPIENGDKQTLLEFIETQARLETERDILRSAITRLRRAAASGKGVATEDIHAESPEETEGVNLASFEQIHADRYRDYFCGN